MRIIASSIALLACSSLCMATPQRPAVSGPGMGARQHAPKKLASGPGGARRPAGPSAAPGSGRLFLAGPEDNCNTPAVIAGQGNFPYDQTGASTGAQGQVCSGAIHDDLWFAWTPDITGLAAISTCNNTSVDTELAIYAGSGCPTSAALDCNDDACSLQSSLSVYVTAGAQYTIQVGSFSSGAGGPGSLDIVVAPPQGCYTLDLGTSDNTLGLTAGGDIILLQAYTTPLGTDNIAEISATFGSPVLPGFYSGGSITWVLWNDPTNDNDPSDAVLLWSTTGSAAAGSIDTDIFQSVAVPSITVVGTFFVGLVIHGQPVGEFPASLDQSVPSLGRVWIAGNSQGTLDLQNLANNDLPPTLMASLGFGGAWMLRALGPGCDPSNAPGHSFCAGDGSGSACPCGALGGTGEGCANSGGVGGALLTAAGIASLTNDTVELIATGVPGDKPGLILQGANQLSGGQGLMVGDGLLCVGGSTARSQVQFSQNGTTTFSSFQGGGFGAASFGAGVSTYYEYWYRDSANPCSGAGFNFSNAWSILWFP